MPGLASPSRAASSLLCRASGYTVPAGYREQAPAWILLAPGCCSAAMLTGAAASE